MPTPPRLSLCMIVKDEAACLGRCLESVRDLVDEAIVVDTGSTDNTPAIAAAWGAQVYHQPWPGDFSSARNHALGYVGGDWVLVLDADETFEASQIKPLRSHLDQDQALVITLLRQELGSVQSPYSQLSRVFRRHPQVQFSRPYHAMVDDSVLALQQRQPQWRVLSLPGVALLHWGYEPGTIAARHKGDRAQAALEQHLGQNPGDPYTCAKLGALYGSLGHWHRGQTLLEQGLDTLAHQGDPNPSIRYELHYHLAIGLQQSGDASAASHHYEAALNLPLDPLLKLGACNNLANLLQAQGELDLAHWLYEQALDWDPTFALGYYNLARVKKAQGDLLGAIGAYQTAIDLNPHHAESYQNLGVTLVKLGRLRDSFPLFQRAIALHQAQGNPQEAQRIETIVGELGGSL
ncbi:glycosyltransferase [Prochlorothrix hollandica]|nr:glycosyltransferase [Prochlorothrix hollandica]